MNKAILIGSGGHAKVVGEAILAQKQTILAGCVVGSEDERGVLDLPVLGTDADLTGLYQQGFRIAYLGIGNNQIRKRLFRLLQTIGFEMPAVIHPHSYISPSAKIGYGTVVMAGAVIQSDTYIGEGAIINTSASIDHDGHIGDFAHIAPGSHLAGNVTVGEGTFLGIGTSVIPGCKMGAESRIGAGSVIVQDIPAYVQAFGVPCKVIKQTELEI